MSDYYGKPGISQSYIKRFRNPNPRALHRYRAEAEYYYVKEKLHFSKGKLLDLLLEGQDINPYFYIESSEYKHPSAPVESIAQQCYDQWDLEATDEQINDVRIEHSYQKRYKPETALKWVTETLRPILEHKNKIGLRTILTQEEFDVTATMATSILEGKFTKPILDELPGEFQVEIYCDDLKGLLDRLQIDHKKKVFRVIDFKSTGDFLEKFPKSIKKFGYDIQLSFYSYLVQCQYPDYTMLEPVLLVASSKEPEYAEPFTLSFAIINNARLGWVDKYGTVYKGWEELLQLARTYNQQMYNMSLIEKGTNYINEL
jgi:hypothetical protein